MTAYELATSRLRLRLLEEQDGELYRSLYTDPRVMARIAPPLTAADAVRDFGAAVAHNRRDAPGHRTWAVFDRDDGRAAGIGALRRCGTRAEVGLMLLPWAWDGRRSHELLEALVGFALGPMSLEALDAVCMDGPNVRPSRRLVTPCGFVEVPAERPGTVQWILRRDAWATRADIGIAVAGG